MTGPHEVYLASLKFSKAQVAGVMIGANMAFSRCVLTNVPRFDVELGPGALGFGDDKLFSWQIQEAGNQITGAGEEGVVEHHFEPSRLTRDNFLKRAAGEGRSNAYLYYHWLHSDLRYVRLRLARNRMRLNLLRRRRRAECAAPEGCPEWELDLVERVAFGEQYLREARRERQYARRGLVKRTR
jgi:hypothetical protein